MCAAPKQGQKLPAGVDVEKETVLTGQVTDGSGNPVAGAFVQIIDILGDQQKMVAQQILQTRQRQMRRVRRDLRTLQLTTAGDRKSVV